jgi:hypothetical protein
MGDLLLKISKYLWQVSLITSEQLLILLGPALFLAFIMHYFAIFVRKIQRSVIKNNFLDWFGAPGTIVHELGHACFCIVFGHRITSIALFKMNRYDGTLGYVEHSYNPNNLYQRVGNFFIGTGPIWFGTAVIYVMSCYMLDASVFNAIHNIELAPDTLSSWSGVLLIVQKTLSMVWSVIQSLFNPQLLTNWRFYIFIYFVFVIGSHITLSPSDIRNAAGGLITLVIILFIFNFFSSFIGNFSIEFATYLSKTYAVFLSFMLFTLVLNIIISATLFALSFGSIFITQKIKEKLKESM